MTGKAEALPRRQRFHTRSYFAVGVKKYMWNWTYTTDAGELLQGVARSSTLAKRAAENKSGEKIDV